MTDYSAPDWLRRRGLADGEYAAWLDEQSKRIWKRETRRKKTAFTTRQELKLELHRVAGESSGRDPYSGMRFNIDPIRSGWSDQQAHLNQNRHHRTLRRGVPSFDHVKGLGHPEYELCTRETNSAKTYLSPKQFIDLCQRVAAKHPATDTAHAAL